jgi:hypothetical protein
LGRFQTDVQVEWGLLSPEAIDEIAELASRAPERETNAPATMTGPASALR